MTATSPRKLSALVAGTAAAVLLTEIMLTRLFSVLLFYHFSFLAVALALFGLAGGGLMAARRPGEADPQRFDARLRTRLLGAATTLALFAVFLGMFKPGRFDLLTALWLAIGAAVPLLLLGEVLALCLARGRGYLHRLYAFDLTASGAAALAAIPLLQRVQGPAALLIPAVGAILLALLCASRQIRPFLVAATLLLSGLPIYGLWRSGPLLTLGDLWLGRPVSERWNAHSRIRVADWTGGARWLTIDRSASAVIPHIPPRREAPPPIDSAWAHQYPDPSYVLGRPIARVAIIGVGGGVDVLPALAAGATAVDGYEINGRIVEILADSIQDYNAIARRPEVRLINDEARHGLRHSSGGYDVIRASLIDTWAATASGGFVLSENGLYTVDAWRLFLNRLSPTGVLAFTRWYLPQESAEAERLVALAAQSLDEEGIERAEDHLVALAVPPAIEQPERLDSKHVAWTITVMVSRGRFTPDEVRSVEAYAGANHAKVLLAPEQRPAPQAASWPPLLDPAQRRSRILTSPWAIDPPRDTRPFFFLQLRPFDALRLKDVGSGQGLNFVSEITVYGVRVLLLCALLSVVAGGLLVIFARRLGSGNAGLHSHAARGYFATLGVGYMAVQLALHQRLSIILGHPTETLALVIATMLLGTGVGSALSGRSWTRSLNSTALAVPFISTVALLVLFPQIEGLNALRSAASTAVGAGAISFTMGAALGIALPTGIRLFASSEVAVAEAWAINGGLSVVGSAIGALGGLVLGSRGLIGVAVPCYGLAWFLAYQRSTSTFAGYLGNPAGRSNAAATA